MAVVEELLAAAKQVAAEADVYHVSFEETPVAFEGNQLKSILTRQSEGIALRLVKDGRIGFASAMGAQRWQEILDHALETAQFGAEARFHLPGAAAFPVLSVYDADRFRVPPRPYGRVGPARHQPSPRGQPGDRV